MAAKFVPLADDVNDLQVGQSTAARFFQGIAKQGHADGRPGQTQQGTYCFAPSGELLGSDNSRDPERIGRLLQACLTKWEQLPAARKFAAAAPTTAPLGRLRVDDAYPKDGLVLRIYSRDLGQSKRILGDFDHPWNSDMVWFSKVEMLSLLPARREAGQRHAAPEALVRRLARLHFVDNVLGQGLPFPPNAVQQAGWSVEISKIDGAEVHLRLTGQTRAAAQNRSVETRLLGRAVFDATKGCCTQFEMIAAGTRTGAPKQTYIRNDAGTGSIGFALILATDTPQDRIAPTFFPAYGWR